MAFDIQRFALKKTFVTRLDKPAAKLSQYGVGRTLVSSARDGVFACGTTRMSETNIAASKPKRQIGCKVISAASGELKQSSVVSPAAYRQDRAPADHGLEQLILLANSSDHTSFAAS
jgi:hypothetical protein